METSWSDRASFANWLEDREYFECAMVRSIAPRPSESLNTCPSVVTMELAYMVGGGLKAGDTIRLGRSRLTFFGVGRFEFELSGTYSPEHRTDGFELLESSCPISVEIDIPNRLVIDCERVAWDELPEVAERVRPWEDEREVFITLAEELPHPERFVEKCQATTGLRLAWRALGGDAVRPSDVPPTGYDGWFLQLDDRVSKVSGGVLLRIGRRTGEASVLPTLTLTHWTEPGGAMASEERELWAAVLRTTSTLKIESARCGNRELDSVGYEDLAERMAKLAGLPWHPGP